ncbi:hypothetical protein EJ04DRAFT_137122 [Polyplosphaeria fusca]|uniref:Uncharacterized protein n=1 Tax=Polyplosphaeria fusca TaxID=682080 RepID=A0A9P4QM48_9PLEO|nr:hypothetical protein EJ04DRAFT_137122 [Polyplosphaeria fusca]
MFLAPLVSSSAISSHGLTTSFHDLIFLRSRSRTSPYLFARWTALYHTTTACSFAIHIQRIIAFSPDGWSYTGRARLFLLRYPNNRSWLLPQMDGVFQDEDYHFLLNCTASTGVMPFSAPHIISFCTVQHHRVLCPFRHPITISLLFLRFTGWEHHDTLLLSSAYHWRFTDCIA